MAVMDTGAFHRLLLRMTGAVCAGDAEAVASCFTPQGVYHDGFYGAFKGRAEIARMVRDLFHRDARDFTWTLSNPVCDGSIGYASYDFSYVSKMTGNEGRKVGFSGISCCELEGDLIRRYGEIFERAPVLAKLGFTDARIMASVKRWAGGR